MTPKGEVGPTAVENIADRLGKACEKLVGRLLLKLPAGKTVAVGDFTDASGGVRRLSVLAADDVERKLIAAGRKVAVRRELNAVLIERKVQLATASPKEIQLVCRMIRADTLVIGKTVQVGKEVLLSAKTLNMRGEVTASTDNVLLTGDDLASLMWYVRRPTGPQTSGDLPPLTLRYEFVTPSGSGEARLADGSTVRSQQKFKICVQPNSDCYLYVLLYNSKGEASVLFPHKKIKLGNSVRGGMSYEIPSGTTWYWFDENPGAETFYVVASYSRLENLDGLLAEMQQAGPQRVRVASSTRKEIETVITRGMVAKTASNYSIKGYRIRGVSISDFGPVDGTTKTDTKRLDEAVTGYATVVKKVTLEHR